MWGQLYQAAAQGALAKLDNVLPEEQRQEVAWARRALVATGLHRLNLESLAPHLEALRRAVRERRRVRLLYRSSGAVEPTLRHLDPYALVLRWGWWYVVGHCHLRQGLRTFRLDRIQGTELLAQDFQPPPDFDIQEYLANEFLGQPLFQVRLRFDAQVAGVAMDNRPFWDTLEEQPDGSVVVSFSAPDLDWAASTALAYGPIVEVLEPQELRQIMHQWAAAVKAKYARNQQDDA
jgi:predicted DNA-binding transcriptional regulator YafY